MATWTKIDQTDLVDTTTVGYVYFEYDSSATGTSMPCRLRIVPRTYTGGQYSFTVNFNNITVAGTNYGSKTNLNQNSGTFWNGNITGGRTVTAKWTNTWYSGSKTPQVTGYLPVGAVAPSGLSVTLNSFTDTTATMAVSLSSYGTPSSAASRYIEGAVFVGSTYGDNNTYRYDTATAVNSNTFTITNSSSVGSNPFSIMGNTQYHYGARANNSSLSTSVVSNDTFVTLPAYITNVTVNDVGGGDMVISVLHDAEGSADTVYTEYSYDQVTWVPVSETFHLSVYSATTLYLRRENNSGTTPVQSVNIVPATTVKLYGSVNNQSKEIHKLYGSVNGQAVRIHRLYGSVNGRSKLIFEDNS